MPLISKHVLGAPLLALAVLVFLGPAQSEPQPSPAKPADKSGKPDGQLTPAGKALEARVAQARESTAGRVPKEAWSKQLGTSHPAYKNAKTHLPHGVGLATPLTSAADETAARNAANQYALNRAKAALQGQGKSASAAAAQKLIDERNQQVAAINAALAARSATFAQHDKAGDETARDLVLRQVLHEHGEKMAKGTPPGKPQPITQAEKEEAKRRYYTFLNREAAPAKAQGGRQ